MRKKLLLLATLAIMSLAGPLSLRAEDNASEPDVLDMSLDDNLASPEVPRKAQTTIRNHMDQLRRKYINGGLKVTTLRDGEVLMLSVPVAKFFAPTATELKPDAKTQLAFLEPIVKAPGKYKVLVAVHTDNTGDEMYADSISGARANAIDDALWQLADEKDTNVVPYGMGNENPLSSNNTRRGREENRRVEFYIVPDKGLLQMAGVKLK